HRDRRRWTHGRRRALPVRDRAAPHASQPGEADRDHALAAERELGQEGEVAAGAPRTRRAYFSTGPNPIREPTMLRQLLRRAKPRLFSQYFVSVIPLPAIETGRAPQDADRFDRAGPLDTADVFAIPSEFRQDFLDTSFRVGIVPADE